MSCFCQVVSNRLARKRDRLGSGSNSKVVSYGRALVRSDRTCFSLGPTRLQLWSSFYLSPQRVPNRIQSFIDVEHRNGGQFELQALDMAIKYIRPRVF